MPPEHRGWIAGATITSLGTLGSRVLGLVRDMATAALLGLAGSGVMDAFVVAFRVPNLFRRLFGEGALAAGFVPLLADALHRDRPQAWRMASAVIARVGGLAAAAVLVAEIGYAGLGWMWGPAPETTLALGLSAVLMPYVVLASLAALMAASLQCLAEFALPAAAPMLLNLCWLAAAWLIAPHCGAKESQAYVLAASVLVAGVLQVAVQAARLRRHGFRLSGAMAGVDPGTAERLRRLLGRMGPMGFGMAVNQINALLAALLAWMLTAPAPPPHIASAPPGVATGVVASPPAVSNAPAGFGLMSRPLDRGATAALYYAERVYEFPLGMIGVAAGTALFPLLSRHAACGQHKEFGTALTLGLRWVLSLGIPASAGLFLLAEPLARLLFQRGAFSSDDALRTASVIRLYASGVWAYCAVPVLVRAYYARGEVRTPVRIGLLAVLANLVLGTLLVAYLAEGALALAGASAAIFQMLLLGRGVWRGEPAVDGKALKAAVARALVATAAMFLAGRLLIEYLIEPLTAAGDTFGRLIAVLVPLGACLAVYTGIYTALGGRLVILDSGLRESDSGRGPAAP